MNVKSFLAGKRGICPHCDARWDVPLESTIPEGAPKIRPGSEAKDEPHHEVPQGVASDDDGTGQPVIASPTGMATAEAAARVDDGQALAAQPAAAVIPDPIDAAPDAVWYVRPASGGEFGPAKGDVMRRWLDEGRVAADSMVWCEGWAEWQIAGPVFPALMPTTEQPAAAAELQVRTTTDASSLAGLNAIQKKTAESNGRAVRQRSAGSRKSIAAIVILGLMIVALFVVLLFVIPK